MPNFFGLGVLAIWPLIAMLIFVDRPRDKAIIISIIAAYLFLPPRFGFDLPLIPPLSKDRLSVVSVLICAIIFSNTQAKSKLDTISLAFGIGMIASIIATHLTNGDPIRGQQVVLKGLGFSTALPEITIRLLLIAPFYIGYLYLGTKSSLRFLLIALVVGGLVYSVLVLIEVRLSPQLNRWFYGFHQHSFRQHVRADGYRPMVFLAHGLWVSFFLATTLIAGAALWRQGQMERAQKDPEAKLRWQVPGSIASYLAVILFLSKSLAALLYGVCATALILITKPKTQIRVALILAMISIGYPLLRSNNLVPVDGMVNLAKNVSAKRARSLNFRFEHEGKLLDKAVQRPWFGWGANGRNRVYGHRGQDVSVSDGYWVLIFGRYGYVGFLMVFGLLALPIVLSQRLREPDYIVSGLCLMHGVSMVDLLPNATITPITWLVGGALTAYAVAERRAEAEGQAAPVIAPSGAPRRRTVL